MNFFEWYKKYLYNCLRKKKDIVLQGMQLIVSKYRLQFRRTELHVSGVGLLYYLTPHVCNAQENFLNIVFFFQLYTQM